MQNKQLAYKWSSSRKTSFKKNIFYQNLTIFSVTYASIFNPCTANSWFSLWEKNTQNEYIIAHFVYFFTCHYSKTVWLAKNLNEIKITHYEKIFSHIKQKLSHFEKRLGINNIFVVSMRLSLFSPRCITLKQNQKIISKISNIKYIPHTPRKSSFKRNCFQWI